MVAYFVSFVNYKWDQYGRELAVFHELCNEMQFLEGYGIRSVLLPHLSDGGQGCFIHAQQRKDVNF